MVSRSGSTNPRARQVARRSVAGNMLVMVPAVMLVVLLLVSLAVDAAAMFLGQRRLTDLAAAIANDAVAAVDQDRYYQTGQFLLDEQGVFVRAGHQIALVEDGLVRSISCRWDQQGDLVAVRCTGRAYPVLMTAWGKRDGVLIAARSTSRIARR